MCCMRTTRAQTPARRRRRPRRRGWPARRASARPRPRAQRCRSGVDSPHRAPAAPPRSRCASTAALVAADPTSCPPLGSMPSMAGFLAPVGCCRPARRRQSQRSGLRPPVQRASWARAASAPTPGCDSRLPRGVGGLLVNTRRGKVGSSWRPPASSETRGERRRDPAASCACPLPWELPPPDGLAGPPAHPCTVVGPGRRWAPVVASRCSRPTLDFDSTCAQPRVPTVGLQILLPSK